MLSHLLELRKRILFVFFVFFCLFVCFFFFATPCLELVLHPLARALPSSGHLIATNITAAFFTPLHIAFSFALLATTPFALWQLWRFVSPGLYLQEKKYLPYPIFCSLLLFFLGIACCYALVLPLLFHFFAKTLPVHIILLPDITHAVHFITYMCLLFGLSFQTPLLCYIAVRLQWLDLQTLKNSRPYFIVGAFILGMLLTPPDVLSQIALALPLCLLYEIGLFFAARGEKKSLSTYPHQQKYESN